MKYDELLIYINNGMLDLSKLEQEVRMKERNLYLSKHTYKIYQGGDGWWYTYLPDESKKSGRRRVKRKTKEEIEELVFIFYKPETSIRSVFDEWNNRKLSLGKIKPATFLRNQQIFARHFAQIETKGISILSPEYLCDFMEEQVFKFSLTARGYSNLKSVVKGFMKRAKKRGLVPFSIESVLGDIDISDHDFKPRIVDDTKEIFYDDEMEAILSYCEANRFDLPCLGIILMFVTGMRVGELVALKGIDISDGIVNVRRTETRYKEDGFVVFEVADYPKTPAGIRSVIVPDKYLWVLDELRHHGDGFIFIGSNGKRLHTQAIRKRVYQICDKLGIDRRSPHKIRKNYGSILLDNNVDSKIIEKQMGHTSVLCTENYYHRDRRYLDEKRKVINSIPQFE